MAKEKIDQTIETGAKFTLPASFFIGTDVGSVLDFLNEGKGYKFEMASTYENVPFAEEVELPKDRNYEIKKSLEGERLGVFDIEEEYVPLSKRRREREKAKRQSVDTFDLSEEESFAESFERRSSREKREYIPIIDVPVDIRPMSAHMSSSSLSNNNEMAGGFRTGTINGEKVVYMPVGGIAAENMQRMMEQGMINPFGMMTPNITIQPQNITIQPQTVTMNPASVTMNPGMVQMNPENVTMNPGVVQMTPENVTMNPGVVQMNSETVLMKPDSVQMKADSVNLSPEKVQMNSDTVAMHTERVAMNTQSVSVNPSSVEMKSENIDLRADKTVVASDKTEVVSDKTVVSSENTAVSAESTVVASENAVVSSNKALAEVKADAIGAKDSVIKIESREISGGDTENLSTRIVGAVREDDVVFYSERTADAAKESGLVYVSEPKKKKKGRGSKDNVKVQPAGEIKVEAQPENEELPQQVVEKHIIKEVHTVVKPVVVVAPVADSESIRKVVTPEIVELGVASDAEVVKEKQGFLASLVSKVKSLFGKKSKSVQEPALALPSASLGKETAAQRKRAFATLVIDGEEKLISVYDYFASL